VFKLYIADLTRYGITKPEMSTSPADVKRQTQDYKGRWRLFNMMQAIEMELKVDTGHFLSTEN
jgi:hypothetical protein